MNTAETLTKDKIAFWKTQPKSKKMQDMASVERQIKEVEERLFDLLLNRKLMQLNINDEE